MDDLDVTDKVPRVFDLDPPAPAPLIGIEPSGPAVAPLSSARAASGTRSRITLPPPLPRRAPTLPPPIPVRAASIPPVEIVASAPVAPAPAVTPPPVELTEAIELPPHRRNLAAMIGVGASVAVVGILLAIGLHGGTEPAAVVAPAPILPAKPLVAVAPAPAPALAPAPAPPAVEVKPATDVNLPITSNPTGAIVTLIDDGDATVVGRTPITATLDPARGYELVVALHGHPTRIQRVAPHTTHAINIDLQPAPPRPAKAATIATAPAPISSAATGVLMISSKPPCSITIDGKPTKLVTPQRAIALAPGAHSITLTNAQQKVQKTITVRITAKQQTKIVQDLTK